MEDQRQISITILQVIMIANILIILYLGIRKTTKAKKLLKEIQNMANALMALVRLNKNQRRLAKVGIYNENGNLTTDGQELLLNIIAKEYETRLIDLAKDWKAKEDKKRDDEDY